MASTGCDDASAVDDIHRRDGERGRIVIDLTRVFIFPKELIRKGNQGPIDLTTDIEAIDAAEAPVESVESVVEMSDAMACDGDDGEETPEAWLAAHIAEFEARGWLGQLYNEFGSGLNASAK